jgi:hypothetical protein
VHQRLRHVPSAVGTEVALGIGQSFFGNRAHGLRLRESGQVRKWESGPAKSHRLRAPFLRRSMPP